MASGAAGAAGSAGARGGAARLCCADGRAHEDAKQSPNPAALGDSDVAAEPTAKRTTDWTANEVSHGPAHFAALEATNVRADRRTVGTTDEAPEPAAIAAPDSTAHYAAVNTHRATYAAAEQTALETAHEATK